MRIGFGFPLERLNLNPLLNKYIAVRSKVTIQDCEVTKMNYNTLFKI